MLGIADGDEQWIAPLGNIIHFYNYIISQWCPFSDSYDVLITTYLLFNILIYGYTQIACTYFASYLINNKEI